MSGRLKKGAATKFAVSHTHGGYDSSVTTGHASAADAALLQELRQGGITVAGKPISVTQLQTWRRHGLIDRPSTTSRGRHGRVSTYGPDVVDQVTRIAGWLSETRNLPEAVLAAFGLGRNPPEQQLRAAYQSWIEHQQDAAAAVVDSPQVLAELARTVSGAPSAFGPLGRYLARPVNPGGAVTRDHATGTVIRAAKLRQDRVGELLNVAENGAEALDEYGAAAGLDLFLAGQTGLPQDEVRRVLAQQSMPSPGEALERLGAVGYDALQRGRDRALRFVRLFIAANPQLDPGDERQLGLSLARLVPSLADAPEVVLTDADWQEVQAAITEVLGRQRG